MIKTLELVNLINYNVVNLLNQMEGVSYGITYFGGRTSDPILPAEHEYKKRFTG